MTADEQPRLLEEREDVGRQLVSGRQEMEEDMPRREVELFEMMAV